jgi:hypothetical protein
MNEFAQRRRELAERDAELLEAAIEHEKTSDKLKVIFEDMRDKTVVRGHPLSDKQRAWALAASKGERYEAEEEYLNLVSEGRVPPGKPVALLVDKFPKPLKPPGRK